MDMHDIYKCCAGLHRRCGREYLYYIVAKAIRIMCNTFCVGMIMRNGRNLRFGYEERVAEYREISLVVEHIVKLVGKHMRDIVM